MRLCNGRALGAARFFAGFFFIFTKYLLADDNYIVPYVQHS
jgi:hypothetical protein